MARAPIRLEADAKKLRQRLKKLAKNAGSPTRLWVRIHADQRTKTRMMFRQLRQGGTFRGVTWPWFADQYTRETDGVTVPAEGGVPNIGQYSWIAKRHRERLKAAGQKVQYARKNRMVKGRLRPSGKRVTRASSLMRDRGILYASAATVRRIINRGRTLEIVTPMGYAWAQQELRPFSFFTQDDSRTYLRWAGEEVLK